jgi:hemolysin activation/secretion protein
VDGATALTSEALARTYQARIGDEVTLAQLYDIANAITQAYSRAGYALSFALVPAQQIDKGVVHIRVVEGFVEKITYENNDVSVPPVIAEGYADKLLHSRPLRTRDLERYLLLANDVPGYTVRAVFTKSSDPNAPIGATDLVFRVEYHRFQGALVVDDHAAPAFNVWRADANLYINSPSGSGEGIQLRTLRSLLDNSLSYYSVTASSPLDAEGTRTALALSYSKTKPSVASVGSGVFTGTTWIGALDLDRPVVRSRDENLVLTGGIAAKFLDGDILGTPNSRDQLFVATLGASYGTTDAEGATSAQFTLNQGLPLFGATTSRSPLRSRQSGSGSYETTVLDASRTQHLFGPLDAVVSLHGQAASRPLLTSEECGFGGSQYGRAYDDSELVGDACVLGSAELSLPVRAVIKTDSTYLNRVQLMTFCDGGVLWTLGPVLPGEHSTSNAQSCGGALSWAGVFGLSVSVEYARSVLHNSVPERDRLFATIQLGF